MSNDYSTKSVFSHLECSKTGEKYDADTLQNLSRVGAPLLARYDLSKVKITRDQLAALHDLLNRGIVHRDERIVLFNTGSGLKYLEAWFAKSSAAKSNG